MAYISVVIPVYKAESSLEQLHRRLVQSLTGINPDFLNHFGRGCRRRPILTDTEQDPAVANFGIYSRKAVDAVRSMRESLRYFPAMIRWVGFRVTTVDVEHSRGDGRSSAYTWRKLLHLALDVMISFSEKPLRLVIKLGFSLSFLSFLGALILLARAVFVKQRIPGWSSLIVSVWFLSGLIIFVLGIVGTYVGKVFEQSKQRPLYIVEKTTNL